MSFNNLFIKSKKILSLMRRMGENIDDSFSSSIENMSLPVIIKEGLISSYDVDRVISFISSNFSLEIKGDNDIITLKKLKDNNFHNPNTIQKEILHNDCEGIIIHLLKSFPKRDKIDYYLKKYGWFLSREDDEDDKVKLTYEKKFDEEIFCFQLKKFVKYLYHVTDKNNLENITKKGLRTKGNNNKEGYMNDERIYLFLNKPDYYEMNISGCSNPILLKINLEKINPELKFYFDPRMENALYTREPIWENAIEIEK